MGSLTESLTDVEQLLRAGRRARGWVPNATLLGHLSHGATLFQAMPHRQKPSALISPTDLHFLFFHLLLSAGTLRVLPSVALIVTGCKSPPTVSLHYQLFLLAALWVPQGSKAPTCLPPSSCREARCVDRSAC